MRYLLALCALLAVPLVAHFANAQDAEPADAARPAPNIVLIFVDDMAYADPSIYGGTWVETPNIDRLAESGVMFTNGYAAAPVCGPSRVGLLTGAYPSRFGTFWNPDTWKTLIPEDQPLLTQLVRDQGYRSAIIGKWNLTADASANADAVFDEMIWGAGYWPNEDGSYNGVGGGFGAGGRDSGLWGPEADGDEYVTDRLTQHAINFMREESEQPFFVYLAYNAPHSPLEAHKRHKDEVAHLPDEATRLYAAMVLAVDDGVGRVLDELDAQGIADTTLVFFISDNGPAAGDFEGYQADWPDVQVLGQLGPLSGQKRSPREGGLRVPYIMSWPAAIAPGQVSDLPVTTLDAYQTIASLTGFNAPDAAIIDGDSLIALLQSGGQNRSLHWAFRQCNKQNICEEFGALRQGDWKYLVEKGGSPSLYNLAADPAESEDLSRKNKDIFKRLEAEYTAFRASLPEKGNNEIYPKPIMPSPPKEQPVEPVLYP